MKAITSLCTVLAASTLVLIASAPANAGSTSSAGAGTSVVAGDVLLWTRDSSTGSFIAKASAAAPTPIATVVASTTSASLSGPEVSPDGTKLAYVKDTYVTVPNDNLILTTNLVVRDLTTGSTNVLATATGDQENYSHFREPTWSPNGQAIAYEEVFTGPNSEYSTVRVVPAAGGPSKLVEGWAWAAAWRPDGKLTITRFEPGNGTSGLWITGPTPNDAVFIPGSEGARDHAWSPNGTQVAFSTVRYTATGSSVSIDTLPASGGTSTVLVPANDEWKASPVWSSDGQRIYYTHRGGDSSQIQRVPRTGGAVTTVVSSGYNTSPSVTTKVAAPVRSESHDFTADGYADVIGRMSNGDLRVYYGNGLGLSGYRRIGTGWGGMTAILTPGDFNGDTHPDVIGRQPNGDLRLYTGVGGGPGGSHLIGTGFGGMTAILSPGDFTGDGHPDVIARTSTGDLRLYVGNGVRLTGGTVIGIGWNAITAVFSPGDFTGDGKPDVIGRQSNGDLRLYHGTGTALSGSTVIGTGWNSLSALFSPGDFNLDGKPDVIGRMSNGDLRVYYGTGSRLSGYRTIGTGWNAVNPIL